MEIPHAIEQMFSFFAVVQDPRRQHPTTLHSLEALITITILATLCGAQNWVEIEHWGQAQQAWLSEFLALKHGIPSHDTFGRVFAVLDPASLQQAFVSWMNALANLAEELIALDGKTIRRSLDRADGKGPIHVVSAWAASNAIVLAQCKVDDKTNEITALPELLAMLNLHGRVVTIDAMGCQVEIAPQIVHQGGNYVLSLKENQAGLHRDCAELFEWLRGPHPIDQEVGFGYDDQVDGGHGRVETRKVWSTEQLDGLVSCERWPGLASLVLVESIRQLGDEESVEQRYYISSLPGATDNDAKRLNRVPTGRSKTGCTGCWMSPWVRMATAPAKVTAPRILPCYGSLRSCAQLVTTRENGSGRHCCQTEAGRVGPPLLAQNSVTNVTRLPCP
jgi:predicted transposase YbfD/YdcC